MATLGIGNDFSKYLLDNSLQINHQVNVIVDGAVLKCNGALLANQSPILQQLFLESDELHLDEFEGLLDQGVMDSLVLMYGGHVEITINNIQTILKFSVAYQIPAMFNLCQKWVLENINVENFHALYRTAKYIDGYKRDGEYTPLLAKDVCSDILLNHPFLAVNKMDENMANIIIDDGVLKETLPIIIEWIDSSEKVDQIIDKVESTFPEILNHKELAIELVSKMCDHMENPETWTRVICFIIEETVIDDSLPIITTWIDSSEKVDIIIDKIESVFPEIMQYKELAVELLEKICNNMTTLATSKRVIKMHNQLMKEREPQDSRASSTVRRSLSVASIPASYTPPTSSSSGRVSIFQRPDFESFSGDTVSKRTNYLKGKKWRLCANDSIKDVPSKICTGFMYVEILLDWIEFSRPNAKVTGDLWASIHSIYLAKGYLCDMKDHIQQKFGFRMPVPKAMNYQMGRCCFAIDKDQKELLLQNEPILLLMNDCKTGKCVEDKRRVLTFRLCHSHPCYVMDNKPKLSSEVCHWYIGVVGAKKMSILSLVAKSRDEVGRALDGVSHKNIFLNCLIQK